MTKEQKEATIKWLRTKLFGVSFNNVEIPIQEIIEVVQKEINRYEFIEYSSIKECQNQ